MNEPRLNQSSGDVELKKKLEEVAGLLQVGGSNPTVLPLSPNQRRTWDFLKNDPKSPYHNLSFQILFKGNLNIEILEKSLIALVSNQEALRIRVVDGDQGPFQFLTTPESLILQVIDLRSQPKDIKDKTVFEIQDRNTQTAFDFSTEPCFSASLIRLTEDENILLFRSYQFVCDGISAFFILNDLVKYYGLLSKGSALPSFQKHLNYLDFVEKQIAFSKSDRMTEELKYWKNELKDVPPRLQFPVSDPKFLQFDGQAPCEDFVLGGELFADVQNFCRKTGVTAFVFIFSIFNLALYEWTGQDDFLVRSIINNRADLGEESWGMVGDFTNPISFHAQIKPDVQFNEHLKKTHETMMNAHSHSRAPFKSVIQAVLDERAKEGKSQVDAEAFTNVYLIMHNLEAASEMNFTKELKGYPSIHQPRIGKKASSLELVCQIFTLGNAWAIHFEYNPSILHRVQVRAFYQSVVNKMKDAVSSAGLT